MLRAVSVLGAIAAASFPGSSAEARSYRVAPQACVAPAEARPYAPPDDVATSQSASAADWLAAPVIYDVALAATPAGPLYQRFLVDLKAGSPLGGAASEAACPP